MVLHLLVPCGTLGKFCRTTLALCGVPFCRRRVSEHAVVLQTPLDSWTSHFPTAHALHGHGSASLWKNDAKGTPLKHEQVVMGMGSVHSGNFPPSSH